MNPVLLRLFALPDFWRLITLLWRSEPFWHLGRSTGFVAYGLLAGSTVMGLAISTRILDGFVQRGWFFELHKFVSLVVIVASLVHVLSFLPDDHFDLSAADLFIPFHAHTRPGPKVVAITTLYLMVAVTGSFYVTRLIAQKTWRRLHYTSFAVIVGATVHALWAGSDVHLTAARLLYSATGVTVVFLVSYRTLAARSPLAKGTKPKAGRQPASP